MAIGVKVDTEGLEEMLAKGVALQEACDTGETNAEELWGLTKEAGELFEEWAAQVKAALSQ